MTNPVPTRIRGTLYPSQSAAARALGVPQAAIYLAAEAGTLDNAGLGRNATRRYAAILDGVRYESQADLARAAGVNPEWLNAKIRKARKQGKKSVTLRIGVVEWG